MGDYIFKLPDLGEGIVESEIAAVHVAVGDKVREDQPLIDMMTDKATVEIPCPVEGEVLSVNGAPGDVLAVGSVLVTFAVAGAGNTTGDLEPESKPESKPEAVKKETTAPPVVKSDVMVSAESGIKPLASPAVRRRALDEDIDLSRVPGQGPAGRINHQDLDDFIAAGGRLVSSGLQVSGLQKRTKVEEIPVIGVRRKIAQQMALSKRSIPHYSYVEEVDMTALEELRLSLNTHRAEGQPKLSILPFIMLASIRALEEFPECNCHYDDKKNLIKRFSAIHFGVATQTRNGLMVPVVHHAEARDIWDLTTEMQRVTGLGRTGKAARDELSGSTVTISSLGKLGGIAATPVINYPEVCIIGVNKVMSRPMVRAGNQIEIRQMMNLSSSFDHRVVDGFVAAKLIQHIKVSLEQPATLFMPDFSSGL